MMFQASGRMDYELLRPFIESFFLVPRNATESDDFSPRNLKLDLLDEEFRFDEIELN